MAIITELNLLLDGIWEGSYFNDQVPQNISFEITKDKSGLIKSRINSLIHEINIVENKVTINSTKFNGTFHCDLIEDNSTIEGFWLQKGYHFNLGFARPVILHRIENLNNIIWSNSINILPEDISLSIEFIKDGELIIPKIKNRELNIAVFLRVVSVDLLDSDNLSFLTKDGKEVIQGQLDYLNKTLSLQFVLRGLSFEFILYKINKNENHFHLPSTAIKTDDENKVDRSDDKWLVKNHTFNLKKSKIGELITKITDETYPNVHNLMILKNRESLIEEYFYGYKGSQAHDTRSAGKSLASILIGIAIDKGFIKDEYQSVISFFPNYEKNENWDDKKALINLYHLMTMTSGLDCDDNNDNSTGTEDKMQSQKIERDWYKFTLDLPMVANPGEIGAYGTAAVNLLGGVLLQATNLTTYEFADKYLFKPLGITEYYFNLTPEDNGYLGGGIRLRPRDMGKIGLLYLSGGLWNSKRIISEQWITKSIVKHTEVGGNFYGYNWWHFQCEHNQIKYDSYYAGGNGGQYIIVTPKLNLVTVLTGGNYNRWPVWSKFIQFLPNYIIPSVS